MTFSPILPRVPQGIPAAYRAIRRYNADSPYADYMVSRNGFRIASVCFALALILRFGILFGTGVYKGHDRTEMASAAITFARTGQIANAYMSMPTGPTAHVAPLYPMLIGVVYRVFGDGDTGETIKQ